jgi:deazaflavin-dependent oxidoreductase (nitroreductase family)
MRVSFDRTDRGDRRPFAPHEDELMPFPIAITRFNRRIVNPVSRRFAGRVRPFAIVVHQGRTSGKEYRTPIMAFRSPDGFAIALTYGPDTDWVRNIVAAGRGLLVYRGEAVPIVEPRLVRKAEVRRLLPAPVRFILRLARVDDFLVVRQSP